jgi:hypothetical protein
MIKKLSILILALGLCIPVWGSDTDIDSQPKEKKSRLCTSISEEVTQLNLSSNPNLTNVEFLLGFPNLTNLSLYNCCNLRDNYRPISQLTNLTHLDLYYIELTTTEYIQPLINLKYLKISCLDLGKCIDPLATLNLTELHIHGSNWMALVKLSKLTSLESLTLTNFFRYEENINEEFPSLDFIKPLINLQRLNLSANEFITHVKPIIDLPKLKYLNLSSCLKIIDLKNLSEMKSLEELKLLNMGGPQFIEDITSILESDRLRWLTISYGIITDNINKNLSRKILYSPEFS